MLHRAHLSHPSAEQFISPHDASDKVHTFTDISQNRRIRRKTDQVILAILVWVYFLQILDKSVPFDGRQISHARGGQ